MGLKEWFGRIWTRVQNWKSFDETLPSQFNNLHFLRNYQGYFCPHFSEFFWQGKRDKLRGLRLPISKRKDLKGRCFAPKTRWIPMKGWALSKLYPLYKHWSKHSFFYFYCLINSDNLLLKDLLFRYPYKKTVWKLMVSQLYCQSDTKKIFPDLNSSPLDFGSTT